MGLNHLVYCYWVKQSFGYRIWGFHSGGYEEFYLLGQNAMLVELANCFMLVFCVSYSSTLKIEATCTSETSVGFQRTALRYIQRIEFFSLRMLCDHVSQRMFTFAVSSTSDILQTTQRVSAWFRNWNCLHTGYCLRGVQRNVKRGKYSVPNSIRTVFPRNTTLQLHHRNFRCRRRIVLSLYAKYKVVQIWPGLIAACLHTGHIWITMYKH
jgi:hypothetical protein